MGTDTYEEAAGLHEETHQGKGVTPTRQSRLNTESTTDLSMDCYNYSDEDGDTTHSCSDTEASFFIPRDDRQKREVEKRRPSMCDVGFAQDFQKALEKESESTEWKLQSRDISTSFMGDFRLEQELQKVENSKHTFKEKNIPNSSLKHDDAIQEPSTNSLKSCSKPLLPKSSKTINSCLSMSQDSLDEQFEQALRMISQAEFYSLSSDNLDNLSTSAFE